MGKTISSVTQLIFDLVAEAKPLYAGLPAADQRRMDLMFKLVIKHKVAISNARSLLPMVVLCILMVLEVYKLNSELHHAQYQEIKRLRQALEAAGLLEKESEGLESDDLSLMTEVTSAQIAA